jgi:hypothetical protein
MRFALDKPLNKAFSFGAGYDFSSFYYPDNLDSDYYYNKGFVYLRQNLVKGIYHQLMVEEGVKDYVHSKAYQDSLSTFQDKDRRDFRHGVEYSLGMPFLTKHFFRLRTKYSINDSNALFEDYHDYKTYDFSPYVYFKLSDRYSLNLSMTMTQRDYVGRTVTSRTYERRDRIYNGNIGLRYNMSELSSISLGYGYNESKSNDTSTEYSGSSVNCGWQHKF